MKKIIVNILVMSLILLIALTSSYWQEMIINQWAIVLLKIIEFICLFLLIGSPITYLVSFISKKNKELESIIMIIIFTPIISLTTSSMGSYKPNKKDIPCEVIQYKIKKEKELKIAREKERIEFNKKIDQQYKGKYTFKEVYKLRRILGAYSNIQWPAVGVVGMMNSGLLSKSNIMTFHNKKTCEMAALSKFTCIYIE